MHGRATSLCGATVIWIARLVVARRAWDALRHASAGFPRCARDAEHECLGALSVLTGVVADSAAWDAVDWAARFRARLAAAVARHLQTAAAREPVAYDEVTDRA